MFPFYFIPETLSLQSHYWFGLCNPNTDRHILEDIQRKINE